MKTFPTFMQYRKGIRTRLRAEYPNSDPRDRDACETLQATPALWLNHLSAQLRAGVRPSTLVLDTLTPGQLYWLKNDGNADTLRHYVPREYRVLHGHRTAADHQPA